MIVVAISASLVLSACGKKKDKAPDNENNKSGATSTPPKTDTKPKEEPKKAAFSPTMDKDVVAALDAVIANCDTKYTYGRECKGDEQKKLDKLMRDKRLNALDTLIALVLDTSKDNKLRQLAAYELDYHMKYAVSDIEKGKFKANEATADALIKAATSEEPSRENKISRYFITTAVHYNNLLKRYDKVKELVNGIDAKKSSDHKWVKYYGVENVMKYGRMNQFDLVKKYAEDSETQMQRAAFKAPRNMYKWTDTEDKDICTWAEGYLSKDDKAIDAGPTWVLLKCKDRAKYGPMILEEAKKRGKAGTFARPFTFAFRELCSRSFFGSKTKTDEETCKRSKKLLLIVTNDEKIKDFERAMALGSIAYQWRDEESLKLMKKYSKHKNKEIAKMATREVDMLEKWLKKKKPAAKKKKN